MQSCHRHRATNLQSSDHNTMWLQELPADDTDPLYGRVRVIVMNNRPGNHSVFYAVRTRITP